MIIARPGLAVRGLEVRPTAISEARLGCCG